MGVFTYVYYSSLIRENNVTVGGILQTIVSSCLTKISAGVHCEILSGFPKLYFQDPRNKSFAPVPDGGQYLHEVRYHYITALSVDSSSLVQPDILQENWQEAYWGVNYPQLLAIKKAIDPDDLLLVTKGVNSEGWDGELICNTN